MTEYGKLQQQAQAKYAKGDLDAAVADAAKSLRLNPNYERSLLLIRTTFPMAVENHVNSIDAIKRGAEPFKWDKVVAEYESLTLLNKSVKALPTLMYKKEPIIFEIKDCAAELGEARMCAAEAHYQEGRSLFGKEGIVTRDCAAQHFKAANRYVTQYKDSSTLAAEGYYQEGNILSQNDGIDFKKRAAKAFMAAQSYVPDYKDCCVLYERCRKAGVKRMALIPFDDKSGKNMRYGSVADAIVDGLVSDVMNDVTATEFLEIVSRDQLERVVSEQKLAMSGLVDVTTATQVGGILGVHEILAGQITQIAVTPENTTQKPRQEVRSVPVGTERYTDPDGKVRERTVWGNVSAVVTTYKRTAAASISGSYKIVDVKTAKLQDTQQFKGEYSFQHEWASFTGDERALSRESKALLDISEEHAPVPEEMVTQATRSFVASLSGTLKRYAR